MMRSVTSDRSNVQIRFERDGLRFDYGEVEPAAARFLKGQADRIRRQCATSTIQIGRALIEAKRYLSHGAFLCWVEREVGMPARTAQAYMRVANWASSKSATVAQLSPSALYLLSTTGIPEDFVVSILSRVEAGEYLAPSVIRAELKAFRSTSANERAEQEMHAKATLSSDLIATECGARDAVAELVTILIEGLSAADFARVRDIVTSETVLADPQLGQNLHAAFVGATQDCMIAADGAGLSCKVIERQHG